MKIIPYKDIVIPDYRMRKEYDEDQIIKMATDIGRNGLYNPPVVRVENGVTLLVQGERRYRALGKLVTAKILIRHGTEECPEDHIPVTDWGELEPLQALEMELSENIHRKDLTWEERASAVYKLDQLRRSQAGARGETYKIIDTAREVLGEKFNTGSAAQDVRESILLAKNFDAVPEIRKAKTQKEAMNILRKANEALLAEAMAERVNIKASDHVTINEDTFDAVLQLPDNQFDCIITDPPYGIDADAMSPQSGSQAGTTHKYKDDFDYAVACTQLVAEQGFRITRPMAHCYMFCDIAYWHIWADIFRAAGWYVWPKPIIWSKGSVGNLMGAANGPRSCYEPLLYAIKGGRQVNRVNPDVVMIPPSKNGFHAAEKPVALYSHFLKTSCFPGDKVVDLFAGCMPIIPACNGLNLKATAIERDKTHYSKGILRLNEQPEFLE